MLGICMVQALIGRALKYKAECGSVDDVFCGLFT